MAKETQFYQLTPDLVMKAIESVGLVPTGEYLQLNSYENRVFDLKLEQEDSRLKEPRLIAKFYRPGRWTRDAVEEELQFLTELRENGVPAVDAIEVSAGAKSFLYDGLIVALFPKIYGRMPQELSSEDRMRIGRLLARLHNVGEQRRAQFRPRMMISEYGRPQLEFLKPWVAPEVWMRYQKAATEILDYLEDQLEPQEFIRIHGDCHRGNILLRDYRDEPTQYFFVDFDDFGTGPVAQDFWMLLSDFDVTNNSELEELLTGYEELRHFPSAQRDLLLPLRGLRIIHYAAWIARRWEDPSFPHLFPTYREYTYWAEETEILERIAWSI